MKLGECIKAYLDEHDMSIRQFARSCGYAHTYIYYIIDGKTPRGKAPVPSIDFYRAVAKAMGMDVNTLISLVDDEIAWGENSNQSNMYKLPPYNIEGLTKEELELIRVFRMADDPDKTIIRSVMERYPEDTSVKAG